MKTIIGTIMIAMLVTMIAESGYADGLLGKKYCAIELSVTEPGNKRSEEVFDEFVKECGNQNNWTASTYEKFAAVRNHLKEFKEDVTFEYFNEFGLNEYVNFLRDKKDMRNSTIGKQMGFLKWFLRWSFKKGHHQNMAYDTFKPKLKI